MSVWVGGSAADVKQPQAVFANKKSHSDQAYFRPFCSDAIDSLMAISGRDRGGRQWRLMALNGLMVNG